MSQRCKQEQGESHKDASKSSIQASSRAAIRPHLNSECGLPLLLPGFPCPSCFSVAPLLFLKPLHSSHLPIFLPPAQGLWMGLKFQRAWSSACSLGLALHNLWAACFSFQPHCPFSLFEFSSLTSSCPVCIGSIGNEDYQMTRHHPNLFCPLSRKDVPGI